MQKLRAMEVRSVRLPRPAGAWGGILTDGAARARGKFVLAMIFDANAARALARRTHSLADCLAAMKRAVLQAAQAGRFEATIGLPEPMPLAAGQSTNNAAFLIDFFARQGAEAWADAVRHAVRAGYTARPAWRSVDSGPALDGLVLSWFMVEPPGVTDSSLLLMAATAAYAMSQAEQVHHRWVDGLKETIRAAALQGKPSVTIQDALPPHDPAWAKRREILQRAGFATDLVANERGAALVIGW
jgi:hypothetical protein